MPPPAGVEALRTLAASLPEKFPAALADRFRSAADEAMRPASLLRDMLESGPGSLPADRT